MNKSQLINVVVEQTGYPRKQVSDTLQVIQDTIGDALQARDNVTLSGFASFKVVDVPAKPKRKGINPFTKEEQIFQAKPASVKVKVTTLKAFKDKVATKTRRR